MESNTYQEKQQASIYYAALEKNVSIADQIEKQAKSQLDGLYNYLLMARKSIEKHQLFAKVKWRHIKEKGFVYSLKPLDCWLSCEFSNNFVVDGIEHLDFNSFGIDMKPWAIEIEPRGNNSFVPKMAEYTEILEKLASEKERIKTENGEFTISKANPPSLKIGDQLDIQDKKIEIIDIKENSSGIKIHVRPCISYEETKQIHLDGIDYVEAIPPLSGENIFYSPDGAEKIELERVGKGFQQHSGEKLEYEYLIGRDNGVHFGLKSLKKKGEKNIYEIELMKPENNGDDEKSPIDPRYSFFDQGVGEIWLSRSPSGPEDRIKIERKDEDSFHIWVGRLPPENQEYLYLPKNITNIKNQLIAVDTLKKYPLIHQRNILRLFENPEKSKGFPNFKRHTEISESDWAFLTNIDVEGTDVQREFVKLSIDTPDYSFLEGPPGSGKTTLIAELAYQLIKRGKKVLMVSNTHYATDNLLERIIDNEKCKDVVAAVRIGSDERRVDEKLRKIHLGALTQRIAQKTGLDEKLCEQIVLKSTNLVCGTTTGLGAHPGMKLDGKHPALPLFDYLIIDESSKTTFQEFLYPAVFAKKWILVGDIRQLSPYAEEKEIAGNVEFLEGFGEEHQRALLYLFRLSTYRKPPKIDEQWLIVDNAKVIDHIVKEVIARKKLPPDKTRGKLPEVIVLVSSSSSENEQALKDAGILRISPPPSLFNNIKEFAYLSLATWILVENGDYEAITPYLPPSAMPLGKKKTDNIFNRRHERWLQVSDERNRLLNKPYKERNKYYKTYKELEELNSKYFNKQTWAEEWVWRTKRIYELTLSRYGDNNKNLSRLKKDIEILSPTDSSGIEEGLNQIKEIAFPSILESLQKGIPVNNRKRISFLSEGFENYPEMWEKRHRMMVFQYRMEEQIAKIPKEYFYENEALKTSSLINGRREKWGFTFPEDKKYPIMGWKDVVGQKDDKGGNPEEAAEIIAFLKEFYRWAEKHPPQGKKGEPRWGVALLSFYRGQEYLLKKKVKEWTKQERENRFRKGNLEIVIGTIDRFQGREADVVLLSLRNPWNMGFLDSYNRINVGITRARLQLVIFGNWKYFSGNAQSNHEVEAWKIIAKNARVIGRR